VALENTHPFMRELWGRYWIFAHNGNLPDFSPPLDGSFSPVGQTDSERAFCWLLQNLRQCFGSQAPGQTALFDALHQLTLDLGARGACNYLLSNGDCLFAHCSTQLSYIIRQAPFAVAHLCDQDLSIDFSEVTTPDDRVAVIATLPLTDNERWTTMPSGSLWLFEEGVPVRCQATVAGPGKAPA
jgi:predicted glutamine amidotransferase